MSKATNKKALRFFVKELKVAVKEYNGDFAGLIHYVTTTAPFMVTVDAIEKEEAILVAEKAARIAARAANRVPKPVELDADGNPIVRKRGRPKGSTNRPRVVETPPAVAAAPAEA